MGQTEGFQPLFGPRGGRGRRLQVLLPRHLSVGLLVFCTSSVLIRLNHLSAGIASVWITNGLNIGLVLSINPRRRAELLVPSLLANFLSDYLSGESAMFSAGLALSNVTEVLIATYPFRRLSVREIDLTSMRMLLKVVAGMPVLGSVAAVAVLGAWA